MKITQEKLATIAASLPSGTARERVNLALEIWMEADPARAEVAFWNDRFAAHEEKWKNATATLVPYLTALEVLFPNLPPITREEEFARFRAWQHERGTHVANLNGDKKIGVFLKDAIFEELREWKLAEKKSTASEKASNAAKARWEKAPDKKRIERKAGGKTQQVKKKSKP